MNRIDKTTLYYKRISERSLLHFIKGLLPRIKCYLKYQRSKKIAIRNGAKIGNDSIILRNFAKRCNKNFELGNNSSIGSYKIDLRSSVKIGNNVIISNDSEIITTSHYIDSPEWEHKYYGIEIEDYVWIASNVLILPSCRKIGYGAVIGAGAVVTKDVPAMCVMGGNPAQCIKMRKCVHEKLIIPSLLSGDLKIYWKIWINRKK
jgi:acetyltransferase-like isoleucine patch superfamily enzyme